MRVKTIGNILTHEKETRRKLTKKKNSIELDIDESTM
jgi:hypothetical protein